MEPDGGRPVIVVGDRHVDVRGAVDFHGAILATRSSRASQPNRDASVERHQAVAGSPAGTWRARSSASGNVARIARAALSALGEATTSAPGQAGGGATNQPAVAEPRASPEGARAARTP